MKYIFTYFLLLIPFYASSQSKFYKGSLITNNGKELIGYISFHESNENPQNIDFKDSLNKMEATRFYPSSIKSFNTIKNGTYYSYHGRISTDAIREGDLKVGIDSSSTLDFVFLKLITTGKYLSLYSYRDRVKIRYFIQEKGAQPYELLYRKYLDEGMIKIHTENRYAGQLNALILKYSANTDLLNKTMSTTYNVDDLTELVNSINGINKKEASSYGNFYLGGVLYTTQSTSNITSYHNSFTYNTVKLSTGFDIARSPNVKYVIFRANIGLSYDKPVFDITYDDYVAHYSFNHFNANITGQIIYNLYNTTKLKLYLSGGLGLNYSWYTNVEYNVTQYTKFPTTSLEPSLSTGGFNALFQTGIVLNNRIDLFVSTSAATPILSDIDTNHIYGLGIHYWFKKVPAL